MRKPDTAFPRRPPEIMVAPPSHPHEMATQIVGINVGESSPSGSDHPRDAGRVVAAFAQRAVARDRRGTLHPRDHAVSVKHRKGEPKIFEVDERPRRDTSMEKLAALKPHYQEGGTVTAGNSSGINDAGAALVVTSAKRAEQLVSSRERSSAAGRRPASNPRSQERVRSKRSRRR